MSEETVLYEVRGPLAFLTLNRPNKLNAINADMITALHQAMDCAEADDQVRLIVLSGAGRAFSAGFDLEEEYSSKGDDPLAEEIQRDYDMIMRFWDCPKPTLDSKGLLRALVHRHLATDEIGTHSGDPDAEPAFDTLLHTLIHLDQADRRLADVLVQKTTIDQMKTAQAYHSGE